jgi:hypothetical protein
MNPNDTIDDIFAHWAKIADDLLPPPEGWRPEQVRRIARHNLAKYGEDAAQAVSTRLREVERERVFLRALAEGDASQARRRRLSAAPLSERQRGAFDLGGGDVLKTEHHHEHRCRCRCRCR